MPIGPKELEGFQSLNQGEKELVLEITRKADQYLITHDERGFWITSYEKKAPWVVRPGKKEKEEARKRTRRISIVLKEEDVERFNEAVRTCVVALYKEAGWKGVRFDPYNTADPRYQTLELTMSDYEIEVGWRKDEEILAEILAETAQAKSA